MEVMVPVSRCFACGKPCEPSGEGIEHAVKIVKMVQLLHSAPLDLLAAMQDFFDGVEEFWHRVNASRPDELRDPAIHLVDDDVGVPLGQEEDTDTHHIPHEDEPPSKHEHAHAFVLGRGVVQVELELLGRRSASLQGIELSQVHAGTRQVSATSNTLVHHVAVYAISIKVHSIKLRGEERRSCQLLWPPLSQLR